MSFVYFFSFIHSFIHSCEKSQSFCVAYHKPIFTKKGRKNYYLHRFSLKCTVWVGAPSLALYTTKLNLQNQALNYHHLFPFPYIYYNVNEGLLLRRNVRFSVIVITFKETFEKQTTSSIKQQFYCPTNQKTLPITIQVIPVKYDVPRIISL